MADLREPAARVGGYVLAGGRSSRMGSEKSLLELGGVPLIAHAVSKLRKVTGEGNILAGPAPGNRALSEFGPFVFDLHPGCGPIAGIEAALEHSSFDWNLILPVDVPFIPATLLDWWVRTVLARKGARVAMFRVDGVPQPAVLLLHREVLPFLATAIGRGAYKLYPVLEEAARRLAPADAPAEDAAPFIFPIDQPLQLGASETPPRPGKPWQILTHSQRGSQSLWFANLNNPEQFAAAAEHVNALD